MKRIIASLAAMTASCALMAQTKISTHLSEIAPGYSQTSVNTAVFRASSLVSADSAGVAYQFACFYSPDGMLTMARRQRGSDTWQVRKADYRAKVEDAHNVASMAVDGEGYLHVSYDHHGHKLHYRRSVKPFSLELGAEEPMTGEKEDAVTYPEFHSLPDGGLIFLYRTGASGNGDMVMNAYDIRAHKWRRVQENLIDGEGKRNAYWQLTTDSKGRTHISWVWRETWKVETNHDLCYAYSDDQGKTWHKSNGETYTLPITAATAEVAWSIPQKSELINQTSMATDSKGHPYIATYWRSSDSKTPQYRLVWHDGKRWDMTEVGQRLTPFSLAGGGTKMIPIARPRLVIDGKKAYYIFRDAERGSRVSLFFSKNIKKGKWSVYDLTDYSVEAWEPSLDEELWRKERKLDIFTQTSFQGDGEKTVKHEAEPVRVLEVR